MFYVLVYTPKYKVGRDLADVLLTFPDERVGLGMKRG